MRLVVVSPHPDDAEYGAGGFILGCLSLGDVSVTVGCFEFSPEMGEPAGFAEEAAVRREEAQGAAGVLGAELRWMRRPAGSTAQDDTRELVGLFRDTQADLVVSVDPDDVHPFHARAAKSVVEAVHLSAVASAEVRQTPPLTAPPQLLFMESFTTRHFRPDLYVDVSPWFATARQALLAHRLGTRVCPGLEHQMRASHVRHGAAGAVHYAEGFRLARGYGQDWTRSRGVVLELIARINRKAVA